jgi:catechol 2,3-dioxygenase-like lactoylglutathione lyase family enzyme
MSNYEGPQITGVHTVGVPVTDQDLALNFYVGTLGLDKRVDVPLAGGRRWIEVAPAGSVTTIALVTAHEGVPAGVETGIRLTAADADDLQASLAAQGVDTGEVLRWPGVPPMFAVRDQDGNGLEIVEQAG